MSCSSSAGVKEKKGSSVCVSYAHASRATRHDCRTHRSLIRRRSRRHRGRRCLWCRYRDRRRRCATIVLRRKWRSLISGRTRSRWRWRRAVVARGTTATVRTLRWRCPIRGIDGGSGRCVVVAVRSWNGCRWRVGRRGGRSGGDGGAGRRERFLFAGEFLSAAHTRKKNRAASRERTARTLLSTMPMQSIAWKRAYESCG